jgi:indole-3-glycerol phosphate synthase
MNTILNRIVTSKRLEIERAREQVAEADLERRLSAAPAVRDFLGEKGDRHLFREVNIIAEVKRASPSAGILRPNFDPVAIARTYAAHGAACISVLTDAPFFQGHLAFLSQIRGAVEVPLLCKDFILERYQLLQARLAGADAVLLIAEILDDAALAGLLHQAQQLGLQALVEFFDADNLPRVLDSGARLIGINNRNLRTFVTRLEHTLELADRVPPDCCLVSESGIRTREDIVRLQAAGVRAVLIGETLMKASDMGAKLDELRG